MFEPADLIPGLAAHAREPLSSNPTPLEALPNLGREFGITLTAKRDDCQALAFGGNKVRHLEYYFGAALEARADSVLITGALQSNFTRLTTAAARRLGRVLFLHTGGLPALFAYQNMIEETLASAPEE